jgi:anti-anti-sigma factor
MALDVQCTENRPGVYVIACDGSLDTNTYPILERQIGRVLSRHPQAVVFDMQKLGYISSIGLKAVLKTRRVIKGAGGVVHLMRLQPQIRKVFEMIQALPPLRVFANSGEMDRYFDAWQSKAVQSD